MIPTPPKGNSPRNILTRAASDTPKTVSRPFSRSRWLGYWREHSRNAVTRPTSLFRQMTSENDDLETLPPIPSYLKTTYSCERPTPLHPPNEVFINQLKIIKKSRELTGDDVGVRAYSTAIAALSAYPYTLTSAQEIFALPGCSQKIAALYQEWKDNGHIKEVNDIESDHKMQILSTFYDIFGVGPIKAREFYNRGWKDLDDVVIHGWQALTHAQQIGLKYYDNFQLRIPRAEVEFISGKVLEYANQLHPGFQMCIVGGYRRGKEECGDVDVVLSHPDESATFGFVQKIVAALGSDGWIKHTLEICLANTRRNQTPTSWKGNTGARVGGFDTLDKALVVWQDQRWLTRTEDLEKDSNAKNPAVLRRVDIIVTPWKTAGCTVAGWSGGTTFQRDLRRYANKVKHLKFDSSGVRSRLDGHWVDLESLDGKRAPDLVTAEKRVFAGLGLEWREPWERCTG
jgi:DNA polymerase IV